MRGVEECVVECVRGSGEELQLHVLVLVPRVGNCEARHGAVAQPGLGAEQRRKRDGGGWVKGEVGKGR